MQYFGEHGFRCIAHDRRGHGRSTQTWDGNDMDTYADDLMALVEKLDLRNAIHVGHSTGGGEVARYIGRHGAARAKGRVAKAVIIDARAAADAQDRRQPRRPADRRLRRASRRSPGEPSAVFPRRPDRAVLRLQSAGREGIRRADQELVAARHDGRRQGHLRLHQGLLRNRLHGRSEEDRRADPDHSRRR